MITDILANASVDEFMAFVQQAAQWTARHTPEEIRAFEQSMEDLRQELDTPPSKE